MEFDEYEYLEKTVEEGEKEGSSPAKKSVERADKPDKGGYRRRERSSEDNSGEDEEEDRKSKRSRGDDENGGRRDDRERSSRHRSSRDGDREVDRERERDRDRRRSSRDVDKDRERDRSKDRSSKERERDSGSREKRDRERERDRERRDKDKEREREKDRDKEKDRDRERDRERREREKEKEREGSRRSRSRSMSSRRHDADRESAILRERELELRESRRFKDKKDAVEPEADPERDQRTVFAYQMPLKATERDVYEFFSKAGKVRDVRLIMDRNSRRSKGVGYIEFYDAMSVPMAIALSGQLLLGQPVMVKPSEAEKNLVQSNASSGTSVVGPYGAVDRKLYVGNLHFNMTEVQLKQIFEAFGPVELVQLPTDPETGHCKGFGFIQLEHAKAAQSLNGKLEIAGRIIKVSSVTDHVGSQDAGAKASDLDDDDGGGLSLNAQSRALLMQKLDRSGTAPSIAGPLGVPVLNGAVPSQQNIVLPMNGQSAIPAPVLPALVASMTPEPIGKPSECLLLKNMFDPATEVEPDFDLDIQEDVHEECSKYGRVKHIHVDKNSAGYVYLRFETVEESATAQHAMHKRWFARRLISAVFLQPYEYDAKFKGTA